MFVFEMWLKPAKLSKLISELAKLNYWCSLKKRVKPDVVLDERPHGDIGLRFRNIPSCCVSSSYL